MRMSMWSQNTQHVYHVLILPASSLGCSFFFATTLDGLRYRFVSLGRPHWLGCLLNLGLLGGSTALLAFARLRETLGCIDGLLLSAELEG